jgi:SHS2 domain-containing protein
VPERTSYRVVPHTSEVALELTAPDLPGLFEAAAAGLLELYGSPQAPEDERRQIELQGAGAEELLVAWLDELIYLIATKRFVPAAVRVEEVSSERLRAELRGGSPIGRLEREIKAATFGGLAIRTTESGRRSATVILDV